MSKLIALGLTTVLSALALSAQAATIYNNGPVVSGTGVSILTSPATTLGFGAQTALGNAVADDFTVAAGSMWGVESFTFYGYQTGATAFPFLTATWSLMSGDVNSGTLVASGVSNVTSGGLVGYRASSTTPADTTRAIWAINADVPDFSLAAGHYWLRWSMTGNLASGPWQPPTSDAATGNAAQSTTAGGDVFVTLVDAGNLQTVELPFTVMGTVTAVPEPASVSMMLLGGLALAGVARRRRSTRG